MDPPKKLAPASPGTPLFPLSPERVNGTRMPYGGLQQSPSMPEFGKPSMNLKPSLLGGSPEQMFKHSRSDSNSAVEAMVARFDGLSVKDWKSQSEVMVRRADMAREMAEMERDKSRRDQRGLEDELKRMREETRRMKKEIEEGHGRERKVSKRLEVVMDEYRREKETLNHAIGVYEKEIRKGRKDAFKSGSSMVKLQEELKATRNSLRITQSGLESEKLKSARREQEAFTAQYQLIGVQEDLQKALERVQLVESERDALKTSLKEEEVARIAAEGRLALPATQEDDEDLLASPQKSPRKPRVASAESDVADKENRPVPKKTIELQSLYEEVALERRMRQKAQEQVEFMKMECQFGCCSCRIAEKEGQTYVHDLSYASEMENIRAMIPRLTPPPSENEGSEEQSEDVEMTFEATAETQEEGASPQVKLMMEEVEVEVKVEDESFQTAREASQISLPTSEDDKEMTAVEVEVVGEIEVEQPVADEVEFAKEQDQEEEERSTTPPPMDLEPQTPLRDFKTITTTTTIPITFTPKASTIPLHPNGEITTLLTVGPLRQEDLGGGLSSPFPAGAFKADGTLDREEALRRIRERRGRARSVAMGQATPRKAMIEGRRDISAPTLKTM